MNEIKVHIYPVGALQQMLRIRAALNPLTFRPKDTRFARGKAPANWRRNTIRHAARAIWRHRNRRSHWNGYLAEPTTDGIYFTHCGHGWTKRRAMNSLVHNIGEVQRDGYLRYVPEASV